MWGCKCVYRIRSLGLGSLGLKKRCNNRAAKPQNQLLIPQWLCKIRFERNHACKWNSDSRMLPTPRLNLNLDKLETRLGLRPPHTEHVKQAKRCLPATAQRLTTCLLNEICNRTMGLRRRERGTQAANSQVN